MQSKPLLISFDQTRFDQDMKAYQDKESLKKAILNEIKILDLPLTKDLHDEFWDNPKEVFLKLIEMNYRERNQLGLSGKKLIEVLDLHFPGFNGYMEKYIPLKDLQLPLKEDYSLFTEDDIQAERLTLLNNFIAAVETLKDVTQVKPGTIIQALNNSLVYDHATNKLKPNPSFIKTR
jgi:hypothetical protein